jgi:hypothetical protein
MSAQEQPIQTRRRFLKNSVRWVLLGGALALADMLVTRKGESAPCVSPCSQCGVFGRCSLPKAQAAREKP